MFVSLIEKRGEAGKSGENRDPAKGQSRAGRILRGGYHGHADWNGKGEDTKAFPGVRLRKTRYDFEGAAKTFQSVRKEVTKKHYSWTCRSVHAHYDRGGKAREKTQWEVLSEWGRILCSRFARPLRCQYDFDVPAGWGLVSKRKKWNRLKLYGNSVDLSRRYY